MNVHPRRPSQLAELARWRAMQAATPPRLEPEPKPEPKWPASDFWLDLLAIIAIAGFGLVALLVRGG